MTVNNPLRSSGEAYIIDDDIKLFKQDPVVVVPDGGDRLKIPGSEFVHKIKSVDTNNVFSVIEIITQPGKGVDLHVHENEDELVYLLRGEIEVTLGDQTMLAVPGVTALLPRGIAHGFTNVGDTPSILIDTILPGKFDNYFVELSELYKAGEPTGHEIDALSEKYNIRYL